MHDLLHDDKLKALIGRMRSLPSVPQLYVEMMEEIKKPDTTFQSVAAIIARDVGMTAKILQMVNSAFFGFHRNITSAEHAVSVLGLRMIRSLVLTANIFSEFSGDKLVAFPIEGIMCHSIAAAGLGRILAKAQSKETAIIEDSFMAGMLHDAGKLVLADQLTAEYTRVYALAREKAIPLCDAERELLGATHAEIGAHLMGLWGLPDTIVEAIAFHHRPSESHTPGFSAVTVVHVANIMEHREHPDDEAIQPIDTAYLESLHMADRVEKWSEMCHVLARDGK